MRSIGLAAVLVLSSAYCIAQSVAATSPATISLLVTQDECAPPLTLVNLKTSSKVKPAAVEVLPDGPVDYTVLWDVSNSERGIFQSTRDAIDLTLREVPRPGLDKGLLGAFSQESYFANQYTSDPTVIMQYYRRFKPAGGTVLYDTLIDAVVRMQTFDSSDAPRVVFVFSDGEDNASHHKRDQALAALLAAHIRVYAFSPNNSGFTTRGDNILRYFAENTGGRFLVIPSSPSVNDYQRSMSKVMREIRYDWTHWYRVNLQLTDSVKPGKKIELGLTNGNRHCPLHAAAVHFNTEKPKS